jgi:mono/diheme cytochrome c family protein
MKSLILFLLSGFGLLTSWSFDQNAELTESIKRGQEVYTDFCVVCHKVNGEGTIKIFPPLAGSDYLRNNQNESIKGIKYGQNGKIKVNGVEYNGAMTDLGLTEEEVADVMNYINNSWGNSIKGIVTPEMVKKIGK